ncbi:unnamed protein product [Lymnaea stagnalis]|uniref:Uncharacterized protein n=1 Tax=Lymnaea stagnalis TaxID=6523 RepID=A0AAV2IFI0_LYMST
MDDVEPDCGTSLRKQGSLMDDQIDSGLGSINSIGYYSGELNFSVEEDQYKRKFTDVSSPSNLGSVDLASKLSDMKIESDSTGQCDSGLEEPIQISLEHTVDELFPRETWCSPNFSPQQVVEIFRGDEDGDNHLHLSIIHGLPEVTMQIIGLAPDLDWLNHTNSLLQTPLHIAVITRQTRVVRRLMSAGASVDVRDQMGNTPLHNACRLGYDDVVHTLITPVKTEETRQNKYDISTQIFLLDLESKNYEGLTCLHLAAIGGHLSVMRLLLLHGANINTAEGKSGRTVLHLAAEWGNMVILKFLVSRRETDIDARTYAGLTPILLAFGRNHGDIVEELLNHGASCETLSLSDDSDADISDEEMVEEAPSLKPFGALPQRVCQNTYG